MIGRSEAIRHIADEIESLESELFGHTRGSFTGTYRDKPGLLEIAPDGRLFPDESCNMSLRVRPMSDVPMACNWCPIQ